METVNKLPDYPFVLPSETTKNKCYYKNCLVPENICVTCNRPLCSKCLPVIHFN